MKAILTTYVGFNEDGTIADLIRDEKSGEVKIVISKEGKIEYTEKFNCPNGDIYIPPQGIYQFPEGISLPSRAEDYGSIPHLYDEIIAFIGKYVDLNESFLEICAHYVILTHVHQRFHSLPYLRVIGDPGSGKSTLTSTLGLLSYKGFEVSGCVTIPVLFRTIDSYGVTLIIDESDFVNDNDTSELIKILNNGYSKNKPVPRLESVKDVGYVTTSYQVFGPKILNGRARFDNAALESRCITYRMRESNQRPNSYQLPQAYYDEALQLRNKLLKYRLDNFFEVEHYLEKVKGSCLVSLPPRLNQTMLPLLSVAADEPYREKILGFFTGMNEAIKFDKLHSLEGRILRIIWKILHTKHTPTDLGVTGICLEVQEIENYKYINITPKKIGHILRDLGLKTRRSTGGNYILEPDKPRLDQLFVEYGIE